MGYVRWFAVWAALVVSGHAHAVGGLAEVSIIDCGTGAALTPHYYRGEYWIAGTPGARYAIEIRSRAGGRLLAVTSVDGINVISGETAGWGQSGYVFQPRERYQITGWRKSDAEVAAFTFTALPDSYAALTGRPANVGVIGVAVFRERRPPTLPAVSESDGVRRQSPAASGAGETRAQAASPASASPLPEASLRGELKLGTGHGEREYSYVSHTDFQRLQEEPDEVIRLRYDSLQNLIAMGVIKERRPAPLGIDPFPASPYHYVPDPPG
jgi:hypothetical protein